MTTRNEAIAMLTYKMRNLQANIGLGWVDLLPYQMDGGVETDHGVIWHTTGTNDRARLVGWVGNDLDYDQRYLIEVFLDDVTVPVYGTSTPLDDEVLPEECSICSGGHSTEWHAGQVA